MNMEQDFYTNHFKPEDIKIVPKTGWNSYNGEDIKDCYLLTVTLGSLPDELFLKLRDNGDTYKVLKIDGWQIKDFLTKEQAKSFIGKTYNKDTIKEDVRKELNEIFYTNSLNGYYMRNDDDDNEEFNESKRVALRSKSVKGENKIMKVKTESSEDTREAIKKFTDSLNDAVRTQEIVNAECMDEFLKDAEKAFKNKKKEILGENKNLKTESMDSENVEEVLDFYLSFDEEINEEGDLNVPEDNGEGYYFIDCAADDYNIYEEIFNLAEKLGIKLYKGDYFNDFYGDTSYVAFSYEDGKKIKNYFLKNESKKLKTEAIYLVTPDKETGKVTIDLDDIENVISDNVTDVVKDNDATDFAQEMAEIPAGNTTTEEDQIVDVSEEGKEDNLVDIIDVAEEDPEAVEIIDTLVDNNEVQDATDMIMDTASIPNDGITSDVQADETEPVQVIENANGPMFVLAEQLISAYHSIGSLHRNLKGGAWFDNHERLDNYARYVLTMIDEVIEQNIALGGREPGVKEAIDAFPTVEIVGRNKDESYRIVRDLFNSIIALCEECKSGLPGDVISKVEEFENYFRKEAEYKIAKTILGEAKLMTKAEMKAERLLEGKLAQVKVDALKDALATGDDQYVYQDGDEIYYTDESPKKNPTLFDRVKLLGTFITDMKDGKMVANYVAESFKKEEYVSTSKFKKRVNEEKIGETEIPDTIDYVGPENNPELEEIAGDKIGLKEFIKDHKDEIDASYKATYGEEIDKDLYDALADYMYNDSLTGNVQTKEDYVDPIEETDANEDLVNDEENKDEHKEGI